ncbi:MAG: SCO family protein [Saprospiraceae bacterium]|nr:SCO family protein [Saprospiraceae bacterium]
MKNIKFLSGWFMLTVVLIAMGCKPNDQPLPYLGEKISENGKEIYHKIRSYSYLNQDSVMITSDTLSNFVYVADFFFTSCPSICPKVMKEMSRIYEAVKDNPNVRLVSFTIDPKRDDVNRLKLYADNLGVDHEKWFFLTGDKDETFELANDFFVIAYEDAESPGGFDHSGKIILVDKSGHVRSFSEGTDPEKTQGLIDDIFKLLKEYE